MSIGTYFSNRGIDACVPFVGHGKSINLLQHANNIPILPTMAGTLTFTATLSLSTFLQSKLLHSSTGIVKPIPSILGLGSVALASLLSHFISIQAYAYQQQLNTMWSSNDNSFVDNSLLRLPESFSSIDPFFNGGSSPNYINQYFDFIPNDLDVTHILRVIVVGLIAYKGLGGRFWSVSPSSFTHLGSFARKRKSLPATDAYASKLERKVINEMGKKFGCHVCGDRMIKKEGLKSGTKFVADHIPPRSVARQMNSRGYRRLTGRKVKQRFFPQCVHCSLKQSNILSAASRKVQKNMARKNLKLWTKIPNLAQSGGGANAYVHGLRLRKEHLAGGIIASATVCGDLDELDVLSGNRIRFRSWHIQIENFVNSIRDLLI